MVLLDENWSPWLTDWRFLSSGCPEYTSIVEANAVQLFDYASVGNGNLSSHVLPNFKQAKRVCTGHNHR